MANLGIKLTPEETAKAFEGVKLTPEEMHPSKYPGPKPVSDEKLGLVSPPRFSTQDFDHRDVELGASPDQSPTGLRFHDIDNSKWAEDYLKTLPITLAGGLAGKFAGAALSTPIRTAGQQSLFAGAKTVGSSLSEKLSDLAGRAIENTANNAIHGGALGFLAGHAAGHGFIGALAGLISKPALAVAARVAPPATKALFNGATVIAPDAVSAGVSAMANRTPEASTNEPKQYKGAMSNAIDKLRVEAVTNNRARELLSRIDAQNAGAGTGDVTQTTLGAQ